jgi:hypothetical protein
LRPPVVAVAKGCSSVIPAADEERKTRITKDARVPICEVFAEIALRR